ncbi:MAG: hypothetical protein ACRD1R_08900 [Acidobacteriota bacterium]
MFFLVLTTVGFLASTQAAAEPYQLIPGNPFAAIKLPSLSDGSLKAVSDFEGRKRVLHIWASW